MVIKYGDCALHALYTGISRLKPSLACKIFDILSYNCKIWVAYKKQDFKTWDSSPTEQTKRQFPIKNGTTKYSKSIGGSIWLGFKVPFYAKPKRF